MPSDASADRGPERTPEPPERVQGRPERTLGPHGPAVSRMGLGLAAPGAPAARPLAALAADRGVGEDAIALAAALANPWATVVLSGAVSVRQLHANLAALAIGDVAAPPGLAERPGTYWATRAARPWQ